jgi:outer membrane protein insertion porin family
MESFQPLNCANDRPIKRRSGLLLAVLFLALALGAARATTAATNEPAQVKISGFGFLANRELVRLLRNFQLDGQMPPTIDRTFVEDATLILLARAHDDGYLNATLTGQFTMRDGTGQRFSWTNAMDALLPREFAAQTARFQLRRGPRFYYHDLEFAGNTHFSPREARSYFTGRETLLELRGNRVFSPQALRQSLAALQEAYARAGYQEAVVRTNQVTRDEATGAVAVNISVQEGRPTIVRSVRVETADDDAAAPSRILQPGQPYSRLWQQELAQKLLVEQHVKGFPDAAVEFIPLARETNGAQIQLDLAARVTPGPLIRLGKVVTDGNRRTLTSVLENRIRLEPGAPLNRVEAEKSRQRLARLGVFDSVRLRYEDEDEHTRNVVYEVAEGKPISLSVLGGYGSYELLRGGLEFENRNLFGRAHALRLRGVQSFKATKGDAFYTVPEAFGESVSLFAQGSGLQREEISFIREEYAGSVGLQKRLVPINTDFTLRYIYELLNARDLGTASTDETGVTDAQAAAIVLDLHRDRRDNPLLPSRGLKLFTRLELASEGLGGNVDYQRLLLGAAYHADLGGGRLLHLGVTHGVTFTWGSSDDELPFNKRFFPGGGNSVRGYQEGEASPLDADGQQLGAETYTQANFELEQLITKDWSVVAFFDAVGIAQRRADYPWDEILSSVGGGLTWRSLIGPVRLEYGYNLNRRQYDPAGTLHFSIGFPF